MHGVVTDLRPPSCRRQIPRQTNANDGTRPQQTAHQPCNTRSLPTGVHIQDFARTHIPAGRDYHHQHRISMPWRIQAQRNESRMPWSRIAPPPRTFTCHILQRFLLLGTLLHAQQPPEIHQHTGGNDNLERLHGVNGIRLQTRSRPAKRIKRIHPQRQLLRLRPQGQLESALRHQHSHRTRRSHTHTTPDSQPRSDNSQPRILHHSTRSQGNRRQPSARQCSGQKIHQSRSQMVRLHRIRNAQGRHRRNMPLRQHHALRSMRKDRHSAEQR